MQISRARTATIRRLGFRSLAWILAFAFLLQSLITQTHIHNAFDGKDGVAVVKMLVKGSASDRGPSRNESSGCPLCQAITQAGVFSTPSTPSLFLPLAWSQIAAIPLAVDGIRGVFRHSWQSRAPPQN